MFIIISCGLRVILNPNVGTQRISIAIVLTLSLVIDHDFIKATDGNRYFNSACIKLDTVIDP